MAVDSMRSSTKGSKFPSRWYQVQYKSGFGFSMRIVPGTVSGMKTLQ